MKSTIIYLILTVFLLWVTIQIESTYETYLAYTFILSIGIVHGANDISLINFLTKHTYKSKYLFLILYLLLIVTTAVVFFKLPLLALLFFIAISCYHFGEQHFYNKLTTHTIKAYGLYFCYGMLIFGLLFYFNSFETSSIIFELTNVFIDKTYFLYFLISGFLSLLFMFFFNSSNFKSEVNLFEEIFLILLFSLLFKLATLLWAFAIYFIVWHSLPSLIDQASKLYGTFSRKSFFNYLKASIPTWLISLLGLSIVYYISTYIEIRFITLFFAFLAAITIPHVIVMFFLNKK